MAKKRDEEVNLSEKFDSLVNAKPTFHDENDEDLIKIDDIVPNYEDSEHSADEVDLVQFRKLNIEFLDADDSKYSGKKCSRIEHAKAFGSDSSDIEESTDENGEQPPFCKDFELEDSDENRFSVDSKSIDEDVISHPSHESRKLDGKILTEVILKKPSEDIIKGNAIRNQLLIWDMLLECRMKFQKSLTSSNQLPKFHKLEKFTYSGGEDFKNSLSTTQNSFKRLLNSLLELHDILLQKNNNYKYCTIKHKIYSDDEDAEEDDNASSVKRIRLSDFSNEIENRHKQLESFRNMTIQRWNDKTRTTHIGSKNFNAFEQSTLKQIEHVLLDKPRLIKRTQIKRSNYHILGQSDDDDDDDDDNDDDAAAAAGIGDKYGKDACPPKKQLKIDESETYKNKKTYKKHYKEIFDDDDFYHQLLSDYIKRKSSDVSDPIELSRQWIQVEKMRSKMKKKVDTRATKGRKIRYVVHQKLVNFMMPIESVVHNEGSKIELFNSIFGKNQNL